MKHRKVVVNPDDWNVILTFFNSLTIPFTLDTTPVKQALSRAVIGDLEIDEKTEKK